ncbi:MAG: hypothetical protein ACPGOY_10320 [Rhodospirillaceae bacterium]
MIYRYANEDGTAILVSTDSPDATVVKIVPTDPGNADFRAIEAENPTILPWIDPFAGGDPT